MEASLRGRLKQVARTGDRVVAGDRVVLFPVEDGSYTIEEVEPRRTEVVRRGMARGKPRVVAANVDRVVAVVAARDPDPGTEWIDRTLVMAEVDGLDAVLVINKTDLPGASEEGRRLASLYGDVGYTVLTTSAVSGSGLPGLKEVLCRGSSVLVGPSGVGKSSLLNAVEPGLSLRVGPLSAKVRRGRHTTVATRLIPLSCGGAVVDTPGFGRSGLWKVEGERLDEYFPEFRPFRAECRFPDCRHMKEPDCAVQAAVDRGEIPASRYGSFTVLMEEEASRRRGG